MWVGLSSPSTGAKIRLFYDFCKFFDNFVYTFLSFSSLFLPISSIKIGVFLIRRMRRREGERTLKVKNRHAHRGFAKGTVGMTEEGVLGEIHPPTFGKPPLGAAREGLKAPGWGRGHQQRASKFW